MLFTTFYINILYSKWPPFNEKCYLLLLIVTRINPLREIQKKLKLHAKNFGASLNRTRHIKEKFLTQIVVKKQAHYPLRHANKVWSNFIVVNKKVPKNSFSQIMVECQQIVSFCLNEIGTIKILQKNVKKFILAKKLAEKF